ncbi:class I SAM-dependent methyltransferase, partial [Klebsiella pneumoniae]|nr:class I SAM-dependent methyltransferase [Klebsiella pneumoniae]
RTVFATDLHLDIARRLVENLGLANVTFLPADHWQDALPDQEIETIIAADVLEHITQRREVLSLLGRKLTPGGRLVVCGPTENWLYRLGRRIVG